MKTAWLPTAPKNLINAYETKKIGIGQDILERLLSDPQMSSVWTQLTISKANSTRWIMVFGNIVSAKGKSNTAAGSHKPGKPTKLRQTRSDESDKYKMLAGKFAELAKEIDSNRIRNKLPKGPLLDLPLYEYFPEDVLKALHVKNWEGMHSFERDAVVPQLQGIWPTAPELLRGIAARASRLADDAMTAPRPDDRKKGDIAARTFIWHLANSVQPQFNAPILKEIGMIATVVLNPPEGNVYDKAYVERVLNSRPPKKQAPKAV